MDIPATVIAKAPSLDALKIYAYFFERFGGASGSLRAISYEALVAALDRAAYYTERGAAFTVAVVRKRLAQLQEIGVVVLEKIKGAVFSLLFRPDVSPSDDSAEAVDHYGGKSLFDFVSKTTPETKQTAPQEKKYINKNKLINKHTREDLKIQQDATTQPTETTPEVVDESKPTPEDALAKVDRESKAFKTFRGRVASILREPTLRSGLVDRLTAAVALRFVSAGDALALCRRAVESRELWTRTGGQKGVKWAWQEITPRVVEMYKTHEYRWTATPPGIEPEARRVVPVQRRRLVDNSGRVIEEGDD